MYFFREWGKGKRKGWREWGRRRGGKYEGWLEEMKEKVFEKSHTHTHIHVVSL